MDDIGGETAHIVCMHTEGIRLRHGAKACRRDKGELLMQQRITKRVVDRLRPGQIIADSNPVGFVVRRLPSGAATYGFRFRHPRSGRQHWIGLGVHGDVTAEQARTKALQLAKDVRHNKQPVSARQEAAQRRAIAGGTVSVALDVFLDRYVKPNLRSAREIERCFERYVKPVIGSMPLHEVRRRDIVHVLDKIEDAGAPVMADRVLAHLRKAFRWHAARDDQFSPPMVPGMARTKPKERERSRRLDDTEIADLYTALDALHGSVPKHFASYVKTLLLTGQRRGMVAAMTWEEIDVNDWLVPKEKNKTKLDDLVPLTDTVLALLGPKATGYVFSSDGGKTPFSGFSKTKAALDAKLADIRKAAGRPAMQHWCYHDLRRSCRSLLSRCAVPSDHAERVLLHKINGVRGVYDRHEYRDEKRAALEKLDALVERIVKPGQAVVRFPKRRKGK
jgi:integrase